MTTMRRRERMMDEVEVNARFMIYNLRGYAGETSHT